MMKFILYLYLISCILSKFNSFGQDYLQTSSPCPDIYRETSPGYGQLTVPSPQIGEMLVVRVEFVLFGRLVSKDVGSLNLSTSKEETIQMILNGASTINYVLRFPQIPNSEAPPQITRIYYNDNLVCSSEAESSRSGTTTTIKFQHSLQSERRITNNLSNNNNPNVYYSSDDDNTDFTVYRERPTINGMPQISSFQHNNPQRPVFLQPPKQHQLITDGHTIINNNNNRPNVFFTSIDDNDEFTIYEPPLPTYAKPQTTTPQYNNPKRPVFVQQQQPKPQLPQQPPKLPESTTNNIVPQPPPTQPTVPAAALPSNVRDEDICGTVDPRFRINPLVVGGDNIRYGTWPWLAAIFVSKAKSFAYQCGGSLVSNRVVVSAAHCFRIGGSTIAATKLYVQLGRHNLDLWEEEGEQRRQASLIQVHDDYKLSNSDSFDADIAVIVLKRVVEYTPYVKPICLWSGNNELRQIENQSGTVVGWGLSDSENESEPKTIDVPIVSQEVCLRESSDSFKKITSNRTFCAGDRNGTGPCNGDSGSGLALQQNKKWALRGIVSVSAATDINLRKCDLTQFVVYTDAAKFGSFIKEYVNLSV